MAEDVTAQDRVVVIGSGFGGLAAAVRLRVKATGSRCSRRAISLAVEPACS